MAWKAPTEPREHKASGRGMIYEPSLDDTGNVIRLANGKIKYKQRYFAGKYKSQEMWADFEQWKRERGLIANGHTVAGIDHKENDIGFINSKQGLLCHFFINALFIAMNTTGINNNKLKTVVICLTVFPVPG